MPNLQEIAVLLDERSVNFEKISQNSFQQMVTAIKGSKIATLLAMTVPSGMRKTGNPFWGDCFKIQRINVVINPSDAGYSTSVNKQRLKEGKEASFEAQPRLFGTKLHNLPVIAHVNVAGEGKFYLWVKTERVLSYHYINRQGKILDKIEVEKFIPPKKESLRQGTEKPITVRNFTMDNIIGVVMDSKGYLVD